MKPGTPCPLWLPTRLPVRELQAQGGRPGTSPSCICRRALEESLLGPEVGGGHRISDEWGAVSLPPAPARGARSCEGEDESIAILSECCSRGWSKVFWKSGGREPQKNWPGHIFISRAGDVGHPSQQGADTGSGEQSCSQEFGWT